MLKSALGERKRARFTSVEKTLLRRGAGEDDVVVFRKVSRGESDWDIRVGVRRDDDGRGRAQRWGVFGEFRDVFKSAKSENVRGSDGVEIELKKMIEDVRANDDEEEYERMKERVEKAPILSLLFEKEGGGEEMMMMMNNNNNKNKTAAAAPPPLPPNNRNRRNRHKKSASLSSRQKETKRTRSFQSITSFSFTMPYA